MKHDLRAQTIKPQQELNLPGPRTIRLFLHPPCDTLVATFVKDLIGPSVRFPGLLVWQRNKRNCAIAVVPDCHIFSLLSKGRRFLPANSSWMQRIMAAGFAKGRMVQGLLGSGHLTVSRLCSRWAYLESAVL